MRATLFTAVASLIVMTALQADEETIAIDKLPKEVTAAIQKRFSGHEIQSAAKEADDGKVLYEVILNKDGKKTEVSLTAAGVITEIEEQLEAKDLPKPVAKALEDKFPKATYEKIESEIKVVDGKETLEGYEVKLVDQNKKRWEVEILPDGKIKEASEIKSKK